MANTEFFGAYEKVATLDKESSGYLGSSESAIGCTVSFEFSRDENEEPLVNVISPHGFPFGSFDPAFSRRLSSFHDIGWKCIGLLSLVGFSEGKGYWGEFAVLAFPPEQAGIWGKFADKLAKSLADGRRMNVDLTLKSSRAVVESKGDWFNLKPAKAYKTQTGEVIVKKHRSAKDKLINKAVENNKGCIAGSIVFWAGVAALAVLAVWWFLLR